MKNLLKGMLLASYEEFSITRTGTESGSVYEVYDGDDRVGRLWDRSRALGLFHDLVFGSEIIGLCRYDAGNKESEMVVAALLEKWGIWSKGVLRGLRDEEWVAIYQDGRHRVFSGDALWDGLFNDGEDLLA